MFIPKNYSKKNFLSDIFIGLIIALVSVPISMGYSQVAGLPVVNGLYGSLLPIVVFGLLSSSPRFVFGVDAAPAALVGGMIASLGIVSESPMAQQIVPVISLLTALWLLFFYFIKADRILKFISQPVMGGFITGIGVTIICMQIPKLFGGSSGTGEIIELVEHIIKQAQTNFHPLSLGIGAGTVAIILVCKKFVPKIPMQAILMFVGAGATYFFGLEKFGVKTLPQVTNGLPQFIIPNVLLINGQIKEIIIPSISIAVVILSETLLATNNIALKHNDKINTRREILAYSLGNAVASVSGCCPVNGSVSRTGIAGQFGVKSQTMSLAAGFFMLMILLFGTGFIQFLPIPVLTGIVISALIGTFEFSLAHKLRDLDKTEFFIFYAAFFSVLFLGSIYGVIIGVLLSSLTFIIRQSNPSVDFMGIVPGMKGYYSLTSKGTAAVPIKGVIIYKFSGPLFYANISQLTSDLEETINKNTNIVVIDASGIGSMDATAAERLLMLYEKLSKQNIRMYITGHPSNLNDQLRAFGAGKLIQEGVVRQRIQFALDDAGLERPYPADESFTIHKKIYSTQIAEFEWAFGKDSEKIMRELAEKIANEIHSDYDDATKIDLNLIRQKEKDFAKAYWSSIDEDEFLDMLEMEILTMFEQGKISAQKESVLEAKISAMHTLLEEKLLDKGTEAIKKVIHHRHILDLKFKERHPEAWKKLEHEREKHILELAQHNIELARTLTQIIADEEKKSSD